MDALREGEVCSLCPPHARLAASLIHIHHLTRKQLWHSSIWDHYVAKAPGILLYMGLDGGKVDWNLVRVL